jgi:serine/threonine-protein kinase
MISKIIGGCQILEQIARGGMGVVYKARQLNLKRTVAIKILSEELSKDKTYVERFIQEARSAAVLSHGNIVHINDVGDHNGIFYFIMEYVDGENLRDILAQRGYLDVPRTLEIALQVAHALQHAHRRGIIHRDIKPENIMITREGVVKLADMGLAKRISSRDLCGITNTGSIFGTPFYMAPEQAKDFSKVDRRSDIYSLGVTIYKALTGKVPYDGRTPIEVMIKTLEGKHAKLRELRPEIPAEVEQMVERMISRDPGQRYQEAGELITIIKDLPDYRPAAIQPISS